MAMTIMTPMDHNDTNDSKVFRDPGQCKYPIKLIPIYEDQSSHPAELELIPIPSPLVISSVCTELNIDIAIYCKPTNAKVSLVTAMYDYCR